MKIIVGLGNPGTKYQYTRHNIGFLAIDRFVAEAGLTQVKSQFKAEIFQGDLGSERVLAVKPQTFMNLSGESVQPLLAFYKAELKDLLIIHDEVDQGFGAIKYQTNRGHGGHNGVRNIHELMSSSEYDRLRFGVGKSPNPNIDTGTHVLQNFTEDEATRLKDLLGVVSDSLKVYISQGFQKAASQFNRAGV